MGISAVIFGCSGHEVTAQERAFFQEMQPWGFILFARNIDNPEQVARLTDQLRECVDHSTVPILIDQEGGRVRRLRPPHWPDYHSAELIGSYLETGDETASRIAWLQSRLMAVDLIKIGINVDCLPVLDVPIAGSDDVIGDRAYSNTPQEVAKLGRAAAEGLLAGGVVPVMKHIPGHGRALVDSHKDLPRVDTDLRTLQETDFAPFKALHDLPMAMTGHVVYEAIDPDEPATTSNRVLTEIVRGEIGFDGLIICDDLSMHALSGDFSQRARSAFAAGCDIVLHCNGVMDEMKGVAEGLRVLEGRCAERALATMARTHKIEDCDEIALRQEFASLCDAQPNKADPTERMLL